MQCTILHSAQCLEFVFPRIRFSRRRPRCGREADQQMYSQRPTFGEENKDEAKSAWKHGGGGVATNVEVQLENKLPANAYTPPLVMIKLMTRSCAFLFLS